MLKLSQRSFNRFRGLMSVLDRLGFVELGPDAENWTVSNTFDGRVVIDCDGNTYFYG